MRLRPALAATAVITAAALVGCTDSGDGADDETPTVGTTAGTATATATLEPPADEPAATASFVDPDGQEVGTVELRETDGGTEVTVEVSGLEPGFHGLHVHGIGQCEPDSPDPSEPETTGDFLSAGPHLNPDDSDHGEHAGDLSPLLVTEAGEATLTQVTDRFTVADLQDDDGTAFMVHSDRDNFAHIPERYGQPDDDTLGTGDAGDRVACAVVE